jgi:uncharacterized protein (TIGR03118 family)
MRNWLRIAGRANKATSPRRRFSSRLTLESLEDRCLLSTAVLQTNLVSDIPGLAAVTDSQLINPWGLTAGGKGPFWVSDNQDGVSTLYNGQGTKFGLVVNIPSAAGSPFSHATPTGTVFNTDPNSKDFNVTDSGTTAPAIFLFDTLDGTIDGWNGASDNAVMAFPPIPGAIYTGLAIDTSTTFGNTLLYAADWGKGTLDVFTGNYEQIDQTSFQDPAIPKDFRPFNVQDLPGGTIAVAYAKFDPTTGADTGTGGFVALFTRDGTLMQTIKSGGHLNSPWGIAVAPAGFGDLGGDLLVGNFGDGHINAFNSHGRFVQELKDGAGNPIAIENLWALRVGNGGLGGDANTVYFTAGLTDAPATLFGATDGLLGSLQAVPSLPRREPVLPNLANGAVQTFTTVAATNGDVNPYGVAFVPHGIQPGGLLKAGDLLVSNFNSSTGGQGTGTTIVDLGPNGQQSVFFQGSPGLGLTTALGVLKSGFVLVGNVPAVNGVAQQGSLIVLDSNGNVVTQLTSGQFLDGPWDLAVNDHGDEAQVFVSNVLSGTVTRINLSISHSGKLTVESETQIASGYATRTDPNALVVGPTGLAFDAARDILYVASTGDNAIFAIPNAARSQGDHGTGRLVVQNDPNLHGPLGLVIAPNGDLIASNGDAQNPDPNDVNQLVEFTPAGAFVGKFQIDSGAPGAAFGIALSTDGGQLRFAAVDDNTNTVTVWTFEQKHPRHAMFGLEELLDKLADLLQDTPSLHGSGVDNLFGATEDALALLKSGMLAHSSSLSLGHVAPTPPPGGPLGNPFSDPLEG